VGAVVGRSTAAGAVVKTDFEMDFDGFRADGFFFVAVEAALRAGFFGVAFLGATFLGAPLDLARTDAFAFLALRWRFAFISFLAIPSS
jgi:hypothetical protein